MGDPALSPSVENYMIGKGVLSIAKWTDGSIGEHVDVGNCPRFEYEPNEQTIEHFSSRAGTKELDKEVTIQVGYSLNFTLDEISIENLRMFMRATLEGTNVLRMNQAINQEYAIKFVADNPVGPNVNYDFWKVKLTPNGAFSLIGEEFTTMSFSGKGLSDKTGHADSPYGEGTFVLSTTTTTTTTTTTE